MKKIVIIYGLISGTIVGGLMIATLPLWETGAINFDNGEFYGYTTMVIALSLVFFGVKSYRDKHNNGTITFWKGVQVGMLISLVAAVMYGLAWEISYSRIGEEFTTRMVDHYMTELETSGATPTEIQESKDKWMTMMEYYKNPFLRFGITITEILPVAIIITLLSAALLRKKEFLPATEPA